MTNEERAAKWAQKFADQVARAAGKGLNKARLLAESLVKQEASVKAPTRRSKSGRLYATTPATDGAPLRVVSGRYRQSITSEMESETSALVGSNARAPEQAIRTAWGVVDTQGFNYPAYHEIPGYGGYEKAGQHKTFAVLERRQDDLGTVIGGEVKVELG